MSSINNSGDNQQLIYGAWIAIGALGGKLVDWFITKFSTKETHKTTLEDQLWSEIHDLRTRYDALETKYYERLEKMQDDFDVQTKQFQNTIEQCQGRISDLEDMNEGLKKQIYVLENGKVH